MFCYYFILKETKLLYSCDVVATIIGYGLSTDEDEAPAENLLKIIMNDRRMTQRLVMIPSVVDLININ
jgi:hypothetical protein